jgi:hypothetical protein
MSLGEKTGRINGVNSLSGYHDKRVGWSLWPRISDSVDRIVRSDLIKRITTVDEIAQLKKENKKLKALLKTAVGLLQESKKILRAKATAKPKKRKTAKKTAKKS